MKNNLETLKQRDDAHFLQWIDDFTAELKEVLKGCVTDRRKVPDNLSFYNQGRRDAILEILHNQWVPSKVIDFRFPRKTGRGG